MKAMKWRKNWTISPFPPIVLPASNHKLMSEFKFNCSHCGQRLGCDEQQSGQQIACPACHTVIVVPPVPGKTPPFPQKTGMTFVPESWRAPPPTGAKEQEI
jgi:DNA-directed RNA polymerase subunit RPC12/RpoP